MPAGDASASERSCAQACIRARAPLPDARLPVVTRGPLPPDRRRGPIDARDRARGLRMRAFRLSDQHAVSILVIADAIAVLLAYATAFGVRAWLPVPLTSALLPAPY